MMIVFEISSLYFIILFFLYVAAATAAFVVCKKKHLWNVTVVQEEKKITSRLKKLDKLQLRTGKGLDGSCVSYTMEVANL